MERTIEIKGRTGRFDVPSFLWTENENLLLRFKVTETRVGRFYAVISCGKQKKSVSLGKSMSVEISPEFIRDGGYQPVEVSLEFRNQTGTAVITKYDIEPLYIEQLDEGTCMVAWMQAIEKKIAAITKEQELQGSVLDGIPAAIEQAKKEAIIHCVGGDPLMV